MRDGYLFQINALSLSIMVLSAVPPLCLFSFGSCVCAGLGGIVGLSALLTFRKLGAVSKRNIVTTKFF